MRQLIDNHTGPIAWIGSVFGWLSFDLLRASQIFAALMAGMVSLVALVISLPKAIAVVRNWRASMRSKTDELD